MNMFPTIGDLTFEQDLGSGSFGDVFLYKKNISNEPYAVKIINKMRVKNPKYFKYLNSEVEALKKLNHPNIAKFEKIIESTSSNYILLIMEYCNGDTLFKCLKKYNSPFSEQIVQYLTKQIVEALICIHENNIIHRDLKTENIMIHFDNETDKENLDMMKAKIKIIDFGLSKILSSSNGFATSVVGTPLYEDPKILEKDLIDNKELKVNKDLKNFQYSKEADIWSLGCICYEMLTGNKVFEAESKKKIYNKIIKGNYNLPLTVSREFISFLYGMLQLDGKLRLTARQLLDKSFLRKNIKDFHYLSVNHDLKEDKQFIELKSSIKLFKEKLNKSIQKNHIKPSEQINLNNSNIRATVQRSHNSAQNGSRLSQSFLVNNGYSFYGQSMIPENKSSNMTYRKNMTYPDYRNSLSHSSGLNSNIIPHQNIYLNMDNKSDYFSLNNISNNTNYSQSNNNLDIDQSIQNYNFEPIDKKKDDDNCIVF